MRQQGQRGEDASCLSSWSSSRSFSGSCSGQRSEWRRYERRCTSRRTTSTTSHGYVPGRQHVGVQPHSDLLRVTADAILASRGSLGVAAAPGREHDRSSPTVAPNDLPSQCSSIMSGPRVRPLRRTLAPRCLRRFVGPYESHRTIQGPVESSAHHRRRQPLPHSS